MDGLNAESYDRAYTDRALLRRILRYFRPLLLVIITAALFLRDARLTVITLLMVPAIVFVALLFRRIARQSTTGAQRAQAQVNGMIQETMRGIAVAKSFRQEETIYNEFLEV